MGRKRARACGGLTFEVVTLDRGTCIVANGSPRGVELPIQ